jgi:hypothetical protein
MVEKAKGLPGIRDTDCSGGRQKKRNRRKERK